MAVECKFLGAPKRKVECKECHNGRVQLTVFNCDVYGETTLVKKVPEVLGNCENCIYNLKRKMPRGTGYSSVPTLWLKEGKVVISPEGRPITCDVSCPCGPVIVP